MRIWWQVLTSYPSCNQLNRHLAGTVDPERVHLAILNPDSGQEAVVNGIGSADETPDVTELQHFSSALRSVQNDREIERHACTSHSKSGRTVRRQKKALRDLQAQGFQTLPDFFRRKAEETQKKEKFEAMVATIKAKLKALQAANEEEESSGSETEDDPEVVSDSVPDACCGSAPRDNAQPWSPDSTAVMHTDIDSYASWEPSQAIFEEDEEDEDEGKAQDEESDHGNGVEDLQHHLEDAHIIVTQMLKDLHHGNKPKDGSHLDIMDNALNLLRDRVVLRTAQEELAGLVRDKKVGDFVHSHILTMEAVLNIFLDEDLRFTWTKASIVVVKSQGRGPTHVHAFWEWVVKFVCTQDLPLHWMCWRHPTVLGDEELSQAI